MATALAADPNYTLEDQRIMSRARNYFRWQARVVLPELGRRVIEAGSGIGNFTRFMLDRELVVALENETACIEVFEQRFGDSPSLKALRFDLERDDWRALLHFHADSCVCLNVIEHLGDDAAALRGMAEALPRGGRAIILAPAFQLLFGPIDRNLGHHRRYRKHDLARVAEASGFAIRRLEYFNLPGWFGWFLNARLVRRQKQSSTQIALYDSLVVPLASAAERIITPPFGLSVFAVLEKR